MAWRLEDRLEMTAAGDPARDFCLWPYERPAPVRPGALRSSALLYASFAVAGVSDRMLAVVDALRARFGPFAVVFGVKWVGGRMRWEFYFYDYDRWERRRGMVDLIAATRGLLRFAVEPDDAKPYFMFSVEIDDSHVGSGVGSGKSIDQIDVYLGAPDGGVSAGLCFGLTRAGHELRNLYYFFDARRQMDDALAKAFSTVRFDARGIDRAALFWPEMAGAQTVVIANKRHCDGLYFSRIGVDALRAFVARLGFPEAMRVFVADNRAALAHHLFDVGVDYAVEDGAVRCLKGSFYGVL